jgi:multiple sugar transport system permease protein
MRLAQTKSTATRREPREEYRREEIVAACLFLLPTIVATGAFVVFPVVFSLYLSFEKWTVSSPPVFAGLSQYAHIFHDPEFLNSFANTLKFVVGFVPTTVVLSLLIALGMNTKLRGRTAYRMFFFLPSVTSIIVIAEVWLWLYEPRVGLLDYVLGRLGLPTTISWLNEPSIALWAIVLMSVWAATGYYKVLFLAGLSGIDRTLYESASIDGAGPWASFWHITLPLLMPTTFFVLTILVIGAFQVFGQIYVMTQGGPMHATDVVIYTIYVQAFQRFNMGYASAQAYSVGLVMLVFTALQWKFWGRQVSE